MKILIIDNYDSFTYNLAHILEELGYTNLTIIRNDKIDLEEVARYDKILLSPGPGIPAESGRMLELIRLYAPSKSILGICLGEQAIGEIFGARLENLSDVYHGVSTPITIVEKDILFSGISSGFEAGRYHSWVVSKENFPQDLKITAIDENGQIMGIAHKHFDIRGVQFHPESILTPEGKKMIRNWIEA